MISNGTSFDIAGGLRLETILSILNVELEDPFVALASWPRYGIAQSKAIFFHVALCLVSPFAAIVSLLGPVV